MRIQKATNGSACESHHLSCHFAQKDPPPHAVFAAQALAHLCALPAWKTTTSPVLARAGNETAASLFPYHPRPIPSFHMIID